MQVVDRVEVHVFSVPSKGSLPHAKVEIGSVDSRYPHPVVRDGVQYGVEVVDVPLLDTGSGEGARNICSIQRLVKTNILPVLPLQVIIVRGRRRLEPASRATNNLTLSLVMQTHHTRNTWALVKNKKLIVIIHIRALSIRCITSI